MQICFSFGFTHPPSSEGKQIKIASGGHIPHFLPLDLAVARGMFTDAGLDVEVIQLKPGTPVAQALLSKQVDFSLNGLDHALKAASQGKPDLRMILLLNQLPGMTLVINSRLQEEIKSISDLKGHSLAITSKGSSTHMVLASLLKRAGLDPSEVTLIEMKPLTFPAALENQQIAGGIAFEPIASMLVSQRKAFALASLNTMGDTERYLGGPYNLVGLMTRRDVLETKPETAKRVASVLLDALRWIASHSAQEIANVLPAEVVGTDKTLYIQTFKHEFYSPDGVIYSKGAENVYRSMLLSGALPPESKFDVETFYLSLNELKALEQKTVAGMQNSIDQQTWILGIFVGILAVAFILFIRKAGISGSFPMKHDPEN